MSAIIESNGFKRFKNFIIGAAAAVVMVGALFKILSWEGANEMLMVGLFTEAFIFLFLGILPPHKDYYWEKLYPDLDVSPDVEAQKQGKHIEGGSVTEQLDKMLENNVEPQVIERLGNNLKKLGDNIEKLSEVQDAAVSTNEYSTKAREAASALSEMRGAYSSAAEAMKVLNTASGDSMKYHEQVQQVTKNLSQLNAIYELELQDTTTHLKTMNKFYGGLSTAMDELNSSLEDSKKYKEQIGQLASNLTNLNQVYGNMLNAMATPRV